VDVIKLNLHLISDATGETIHSVARACLSQFSNVEAVEHNWTLVRTNVQVEKILANIEENPGVVMFTLVNEHLRRVLQQGCVSLQTPCIPILDPILATLANHLGIETLGKPGMQHELDAEYFQRIDAMTFALNHDDGQATINLHNADVVLVGVSRTSKTPTCIYLANRGVKAANIPVVPRIDLPQELFDLDPDTGPLIVGLTKDAGSLVQIRRNRLRLLREDDETDYIDPEVVREEVAMARRLCSENNWPVIDVSRRSIEESAAAIMQHLERRVAGHD
jgi:regulator of PEP synthase PpsR (kinase-PPPase family)|tara:strand:- start:191 stop:1024 length:834 start_codon:yes stop_codon:yes gene_type:complete